MQDVTDDMHFLNLEEGKLQTKTKTHYGDM